MYKTALIICSRLNRVPARRRRQPQQPRMLAVRLDLRRWQVAQVKYPTGQDQGERGRGWRCVCWQFLEIDLGGRLAAWLLRCWESEGNVVPELRLTLTALDIDLALDGQTHGLEQKEALAAVGLRKALPLVLCLVLRIMLMPRSIIIGVPYKLERRSEDGHWRSRAGEAGRGFGRASGPLSLSRSHGVGVCAR